VEKKTAAVAGRSPSLFCASFFCAFGRMIAATRRPRVQHHRQRLFFSPPARRGGGELVGKARPRWHQPQARMRTPAAPCKQTVQPTGKPTLITEFNDGLDDGPPFPNHRVSAVVDWLVVSVLMPTTWSPAG
jgi:hypothetical protein